MKQSIIIIGGGIIGYSVASMLLENSPSCSVTLIEQDLPATGASARSAGLHFPLGRNERVREMSLFSERYYRNLKAEHPEVPITPLSLRVHSTKHDTETLATIFTSQLTRMDRDVLPGAIAPSDAATSVWAVEHAQVADVPALVRFYRGRIADRLQTRFGLKISAIREAEDCVELITQDGQSLRADQIVLCPGPWALEPEFTSYTQDLGIRIKRVVALHLENRANVQAVADLFFDDDAFFLPLENGAKYLFSFTRTQWGVSPQDCHGRITPQDVDQGLEVLAKVAPNLRSATLGGQVFCDAYSSTGAPIVKSLNENGRIIFAGAANGSGYRLAPAIARDVLQLAEAYSTMGLSYEDL